jgi:hypothetical protein
MWHTTINFKMYPLVAHACSLSYSGGRDQENPGSKPALANILQDLISKNPITKKGVVEWLKLSALSSNPSSTHTKNF